MSVSAPSAPVIIPDTGSPPTEHFNAEYGNNTWFVEAKYRSLKPAKLGLTYKFPVQSGLCR